jgi:hypothetical protein
MRFLVAILVLLLVFNLKTSAFSCDLSEIKTGQNITEISEVFKINEAIIDDAKSSEYLEVPVRAIKYCKDFANAQMVLFFYNEKLSGYKIENLERKFILLDFYEKAFTKISNKPKDLNPESSSFYQNWSDEEKHTFYSADSKNKNYFEALIVSDKPLSKEISKYESNKLE